MAESIHGREIKEYGARQELLDSVVVEGLTHLVPRDEYRFLVRPGDKDTAFRRIFIPVPQSICVPREGALDSDDAGREKLSLVSQSINITFKNILDLDVDERGRLVEGIAHSVRSRSSEFSGANAFYLYNLEEHSLRGYGFTAWYSVIF